MKDRIAQIYVRVSAALEGFGAMALWALLSVLLLAVIAVAFNPAKFGSYLWIISKLSLAATLGYGFDRAVARDGQPEKLEGLERAMALTRRATLMGLVILAAGLMP